MSCKDCEEHRKAAEKRGEFKNVSTSPEKVHISKDVRVYIALAAIAVAYMLLIDVVS